MAQAQAPLGAGVLDGARTPDGTLSTTQRGDRAPRSVTRARRLAPQPVFMLLWVT